MKYYELEMLYQENISLSELKEYLSNQIEVKEYFIILHDKDVYEFDSENHKKGELKKPHYHCYIGFTDFDRKTYKICKDTLSYITSSIVPIKNIKKALCYGIHKGYFNKYQYDIKDYVTNNFCRVENAILSSKETLDDVLNLFCQDIYDLKICCQEDIILFFKSHNLLSYCISHYNYLNKFFLDVSYSVVDFGNKDKYKEIIINERSDN